MKSNNIKTGKQFGNSILKNLIEIEEIISATIVGSFSENFNLNKIGDLDVVIVCKNVNKKIIKDAKNKVKFLKFKKKKIKKNILNGIAYVQSTFNNTIISIADTNGNVISWASAGQKGFKGSRKSTPYAAQIAADAAASKALEFGMKTLSVEVKGPGSGRETALRALQARGFRILSIKDTTPMPHNGTRPPKKRRV